jgi:hypothetical protein
MAVSLGYVNHDVLRNELTRLKDRIRGPTDEATSNLAYLLGLDIWLRLFFGETSNSKGGSGIWEHELRTMMAGETR